MSQDDQRRRAGSGDIVLKGIPHEAGVDGRVRRIEDFILRHAPGAA